ncbi:MAG: hypothetical protein LBT52_02940 [Clostridiales Family XIII bacterium]|jgi:sugar O-acyltransferase (sialic acid O-acetyltransferase NeuD family)|nr:hypothetical protein [Clostridiales Family XIII bacterium]
MVKTTKEIYIIGAGGFGREVADTVREINTAATGRNFTGGRDFTDGKDSAAGGDATGRDSAADANTAAAGSVYRIAGFIDDNETLWGKTIHGVKVVGGVASLLRLSEAGGRPHAVMAIGDPKFKSAIAEKTGDSVTWETLIHPAAYVSPSAEIGKGSILQAQASISADVRLGAFCLVNRVSGFGHDATAGDFVSLMSFCDICGNASLGDRVYAGSSVVVIPDVNVGADAYLCAGSKVFKDVDAGATVIGNPAKRVK